MAGLFRRSHQHLFTREDRLAQLKGLVEDCNELLELVAESDQSDDDVPTDACEEVRERALEFLANGWDDDHELQEVRESWRSIVDITWSGRPDESRPTYSPRPPLGPELEDIEKRIEAALEDLRSVGQEL
ncbi:MAG: hypothetical protein JWR35_546 [Marmoricola sp.]|jgi:hypothetical protein|nr:hypothetical protein [Marmoricola sp.]